MAVALDRVPPGCPAHNCAELVQRSSGCSRPWSAKVAIDHVWLSADRCRTAAGGTTDDALEAEVQTPSLSRPSG